MDLELAKIKAFYYAKVVELGSYEEATKLVQYQKEKDLWVSPERSEPAWQGAFYRIKPDTVIHPGGEMPRPLTVEEAEHAKRVYTPVLDSDDWAVRVCYFESEYNRIKISKLGLAFKTKGDAIAAGNVIFNLPKPESK